MSDNCIYGSFFLLDQFCTVKNGILRWKLEYTPFCSCIFYLSCIKYLGSYQYRHASVDPSKYTKYNSELNKAHTHTYTQCWDADIVGEISIYISHPNYSLFSYLLTLPIQKQPRIYSAYLRPAPKLLNILCVRVLHWVTIFFMYSWVTGKSRLLLSDCETRELIF